ncbi:cupin domain-containing protein [Novosphingobium sp.]|uniref:cupin domain-containing protein n=1 Tax=Novosphingobium sp. TaxID=1874826 RepID=UPI0025D6EB0D|nr:cupin domain-containing protein [Novosphingobium sp.]MCC6924239.1 cupin domain-containing protein [Novosphingobium sp.]
MFEALGGDVLKVPVTGSAVLRGGGDWRPSDTPGFWVKPLVEDADAGVRTWLMKSDPGANSALHSHGEIEQIYVLEGQFSDAEASYGPGDFIVRAPGAPHLTTCEAGSLSLVIYSPDARSRA